MRRVGWLGIIVGLAACDQAPAERPVPLPQSPGAVLTIKTAPAVHAGVPMRSRYRGTVRPWQVTAVTPETAGKVERRLVDNGQRVKAGQVLFELDASRQRLALRAAETARASLEVDLGWLQKDLERKQQLLQKAALPSLEVDAARYKVDKAAAGLAQADVQLDTARRALWDTKVRAPHDGEVTGRAVDVGDQVAPGRVLLMVVDLAKVRVLVQMRGHEAGAIAVGQTASVLVPAAGLRKAAAVLSVSPLADAKSGLFDVELEVDNAEGAIAAGLPAQVDFADEEVARSVLSVPSAAVLLDGQQAVVFVIDQGVARRRAVTVGVTNGDRVEIRDGVGEGEQVAVSDLFALSDGAAVTAEPVLDAPVGPGVQ